MSQQGLRSSLPLPQLSRLRRIRLASGLILLTYVTLHLVNHALGNISLDAMEAGLALAKRLWQSLPGGILLYGAMSVHLALGLWALYERRHFRWTFGEAVQLVSGLLIPVLLADHVIGTRAALRLHGVDKGYAQVLYALSIDTSVFGFIQVLVLCVAWTHGCLGLHFWLRLRVGYARFAPVLLAVAVLLPVLALLGFFQGGRAVALLIEDPIRRGAILAPAVAGTLAQAAQLAGLRWMFIVLYGVGVAVALLMRGVRVLRERSAGLVRLTYVEGPVISMSRGLSVLDASRLFGVPHASVCGGRGRCSTCRIRVLGDLSALTPPSAEEAAVLSRIKADPHVRLACQFRPRADVSVLRLLPAQATAADGRRDPRLAGEERFVVIMFVDMRDSTRLAEHRLPFDTFFILNRFHAAVGGAITAAGGRPNQILGDGLLAVFGLDGPVEAACRQALIASVLIGRNIARLNEALTHELHGPIRFGIGIDAGSVILGELGFDQHNVFTVMGDAVNRAARLETMTKDFGRQIVLSDLVAQGAGLPPEALPRQDMAVPGRAGILTVRYADTADIGNILDTTDLWAAA